MQPPSPQSETSPTVSDDAACGFTELQSPKTLPQLHRSSDRKSARRRMRMPNGIDFSTLPWRELAVANLSKETFSNDLPDFTASKQAVKRSFKNFLLFGPAPGPEARGVEIPGFTATRNSPERRNPKRGGDSAARTRRSNRIRPYPPARWHWVPAPPRRYRS